MNPQQRAIDIIDSFSKDAKVDGFKAISCARIFVKKMKELWGENTYYFVQNERRFGLKTSAYWERVIIFINDIEKEAIIAATDKRCNK